MNAVFICTLLGVVVGVSKALQCAPASGNGPAPYPGQANEIAGTVCDCCGCHGNTGCLASINALVATAMPAPLNPVTCQTLWPLTYETAETSPYGDACNRNTSTTQTKWLTCQIGFGCCDGVDSDPRSLEKVANCAHSSVWDDVLCTFCKVPLIG